MFWLSYAFTAFVLVPAIFRLQHGRWPYSYPVTRPDRYLVIDFAYGAATAGFTLYLIASFATGMSLPTSEVQAAGVAAGVLAVAIIAWSILSLGSSWRIGQDVHAGDVSKVTTGPYRLVRHPIYIALILLSLAMILMAGVTIGTTTFIVVTIAYAFVQGWNENHRWHEADAQLRRP